jgi:hypothetical protein
LRSEPDAGVRPGADYVLPAASNEAAGVVRKRPAQVPARGRRARSLTAALAVLAAGEGVLIGALLGNRIYADPVVAPVLVEFSEPGAGVWVNGRRVGTTPVELELGSDARTIRIVPNRVGVAEGDEDLQPADNATQTGAISTNPPLTPNPAQSSSERPSPERPDNARVVRSTVPRARTGGLQLSSPIELMILEDGRLLGSSEGDPITLPEGPHEIELVNSTLGYRSRRNVAIRGGEVASLPIVPPKGIVHINALPWAEVWVDGTLVGQTPLANLSLAVGEHEFVFRHPTLGERRSTAIVRADDVTRVSANLRQ